MATEETPVTKETLGEKLGDLKLEEPEVKKPESPPEPAPEPTKAEETPTPAEESVPTETPPTGGETETPVEASPDDTETKPPSKISSIGDKITATLHKISGKD